MRKFFSIIVLVLVFCMSAYADIFAVSGLDDYVALDLIGDESQTENTTAAETAAETKHEPLTEASEFTFAEALAQQYMPLDGSFVLEEGCRLYIVTEENPEEDSAENILPEDLVQTVQLAASELAAYGLPSEEPLPVVYATSRLTKSPDTPFGFCS